MRSLNEILIVIKEKHLEDIEISKKLDLELYGLCTLSFKLLSINENRLFRNYLKKVENKELNKYLWSRKNTNTKRLEWLNKHIELTKEL